MIGPSIHARNVTGDTSVCQTLILQGSRALAQIEEMKARTDLLTEPAWNQLQKYFDSNGSKINIYSMFQEDPKRFEKFRYISNRPPNRDLAATFKSSLIHDRKNLFHKRYFSCICIWQIYCTHRTCYILQKYIFTNCVNLQENVSCV